MFRWSVRDRAVILRNELCVRELHSPRGEIRALWVDLDNFLLSQVEEVDVEVRQVENSWWRVAAWYEIEGAMIYRHTFGSIREVQRLAWQWRPSFRIVRRFGQTLGVAASKANPSSVGLPSSPVTT